ncbi:hypothetical protein PAMC26510_34070 [Caballeronia sordidicola]|uniref:Uncharacterized protein n=1 Tax=Caballeronia sordidicola TaxID=196367 RepID=A0A242M6P2_CABSO|nr:hypothetical protein PAMC26510_34070 [Caballeronia sordidicola]
MIRIGKRHAEELNNTSASLAPQPFQSIGDEVYNEISGGAKIFISG